MLAQIIWIELKNFKSLNVNIRISIGIRKGVKCYSKNIEHFSLLLFNTVNQKQSFKSLSEKSVVHIVKVTIGYNTFWIGFKFLI